MSTQAFFTRRVANPLLRFLLSSPLHGPLSSKLLVLTYTGRRSGQRRSTPVQYAHFGDDLVLVSAHPSTKSWWRNFREPTPATITLRGHRRQVVAEVLHGAERDAGLAAFRAQYRGEPSDEDCKVVLVRLEPDPDSA